MYDIRIQARLDRLQAIKEGKDVSQFRMPKEDDIEVVFGGLNLSLNLSVGSIDFNLEAVFSGVPNETKV